MINTFLCARGAGERARARAHAHARERPGVVSLSRRACTCSREEDNERFRGCRGYRDIGRHVVKHVPGGRSRKLLTFDGAPALLRQRVLSGDDISYFYIRDTP